LMDVSLMAVPVGVGSASRPAVSRGSLRVSPR